MNSLSWFIYMTQVSDSLKSIMIFASIAACIGFAGYLIQRLVKSAEADYSCNRVEGKTTAEVRAEIYAGFSRSLKTVLPIIFIPLILAAVIPSRQTMLLIAGSQIGERALNSEGVRDVVNPGVDLLKTWIRKETEKLTSEDKK